MKSAAAWVLIEILEATPPATSLPSVFADTVIRMNRGLPLPLLQVASYCSEEGASDVADPSIFE